MLLGTQQKLAEIIVHCFRLTPQLSAADIYAQIRDIKDITERAVFKELAKLVEQGMLVRVKGRYAIKVTWILELLQLGDDLSRQSLDPLSLDLQIPKSGELIRWRFRDIRRMDTFWVQLMFVLFSVSKTKQMYVWSPHFWFHLLDLKKELQAMRAMQKGGNKHFLMIGSDSFVDCLPSRYWNKKVYEWSYAAGPFEGDNRRYIDLIDDFILTVLFPTEFVQNLDRLCASIRNECDLANAKLDLFFNQSTSAVLTLENNPNKAQRLKRKFQEYFGH
jgi:hypothetical protein